MERERRRLEEDEQRQRQIEQQRIDDERIRLQLQKVVESLFFCPVICRENNNDYLCIKIKEQEEAERDRLRIVEEEEARQRQLESGKRPLGHCRRSAISPGGQRRSSC